MASRKKSRTLDEAYEDGMRIAAATGVVDRTKRTTEGAAHVVDKTGGTVGEARVMASFASEVYVHYYLDYDRGTSGCINLAPAVFLDAIQHKGPDEPMPCRVYKLRNGNYWLQIGA